MEQPRVPAGSPEGGQWASTHGTNGPFSSRGDYNAIVGRVSHNIQSKNKQKEGRIYQASESVDRARKLLKAQGIDVDHINVQLTDKMPSGLALDTIGASDTGENQIYLNVGGQYYDRIHENQKELHAAGMHSSAHKDHVIVHEIAHQLHRESELNLNDTNSNWKMVNGKVTWPESHRPKSADNWDGQVWQSGEGRDKQGLMVEDSPLALGMKKIARQVSRYASASPHEFVTETFTGGILGKRKYSDEVKKLYLELNGPHPDKVFGG